MSTNSLPSNPTPHDILRHYWGYNAFRPLQESIVNTVLEGKDCLALLPTGGGKSICYQVPALCMPGICLVVSPLIALMKDQVEQLTRRGITAMAIYSGLNRKEVQDALEEARQGRLKFLYVSPERLETKVFGEYLESFDVSLVAVDEAHCISQWGYDFRPPYLRIAALRKVLRKVPFMALTASATPIVQQDIIFHLNFGTYEVFRQSFARPNLSYSIFESDAKLNRMVEMIRKVPGSSLVYCKSRKRTKEVSELLQLHSLSADFYNAGLPQEERSRKQEEWLKDKTVTMACTNAFGMGIDKPEVRLVIHIDVPDCIENYYQEAGRAGRDGKKSYATLLYQHRDLEQLLALPETRYPPLEEIRRVYQSLMNYLQLPIHSGKEQYFEFDLIGFVSKFKHDLLTVTAVLKTLEQEGHISFNEQVFLPSKVLFLARKQLVHEFEEAHPDLEPLIKSLLRSYEGLFEVERTINEGMLAKMNRTDLNQVKQQLKQLHAYRIIHYEPQKDSPQLYFHENRVAAENLTINMEQYLARKKECQLRVEAFHAYLTNQTQCRSQLIASYFGDDEVKECGICDNCLNKKKKLLGNESFNQLKEEILTKLHNNPLLFSELQALHETIHKEQLWQVIDFLQSEQLVFINEKGAIALSR